MTTVADLSLRVAPALIALLGARALLHRRLPPWLWHAAWLVISIRLLIPATISVQWRAAPLIAVERVQSAWVPAPTAALRPAAPPAMNAARHSAISMRTAISWIWAAGALGLFAARAVRLVAFRRSLRRDGRAVVLPPAPELAVIVTGAVRAPALHGLVAPKLLFPAGLIEQLRPSELEAIVAHERAHLRRFDLWSALLTDAAVMIHWFNPLVWMAARAARTDCELACDALALRSGQTDGSSYGQTILRVVHLTQCGAPPPLALGMAQSKRQLKRRIEMIAAEAKYSPMRIVAVGAGLAATVALTFTARAQTAAPGTSFPNGVIATAGGKTITAEEVLAEIAPMIPRLQAQAHSKEEFNVLMDKLWNETVTKQVNRALLISEFNQPEPDGSQRHLPEKFVDQVIADELAHRFGGDPAKRDAFLRSRGWTIEDYRKTVRENVIFDYMVHQQRRFEPSTTGAVKPKSASTVAVLVRDNGEIDMNGERVSIEQLRTTLTDLASTKPDAKVWITSSPNAKISALSAVMDATRDAGINKIGLSSPD